MIETTYVLLRITIMTKAEEYPKVYLYRRIVQAKLFIDNNYAGQIDLDNISEEAYFSKFHFIRQFKKIYGKTPHQYLKVVRIEKAMQLLKTNIAVSDACYAVGFESLGSFSGLFKRIVGVSPSTYLIQQLKIKAQIRKAPLEFIPGCFAEKKGWKQKSNFE
jgi:AraC-like DNA-binding protein